MTSIITISEPKETVFDEKVNSLLSEGYRILSTHCWSGGSHEDGFLERYQAILIKEEPLLSENNELYTLTASKKDLIYLLEAMCTGCTRDQDSCVDCGWCLLSNNIEAVASDCYFIENEEAYPDGRILFDQCFTNGLILRAGA